MQFQTFTYPNNTAVVGRFAPSPSGRMHLGNVFSMLMAWLGAKSAGGNIILRIEDIDPRAASKQHARTLMEDLMWLGLTWDEGPYFQSDRIKIYDQAIAALTAAGYTYPCFCTRAELHTGSAPHACDGTYIYPGTCRTLSLIQRKQKAVDKTPSIRLRVPSNTDKSAVYSFTDLLQGKYRQNLATECGDFIIKRGDGVYAYQLAVVLDDALMGVNQIVRGNDLLSSVPRQLYLQELLGAPHPQYAHIPLLIAPDGHRLSKRNKDLDLGALKARGVTPQQIIGFLAHLAGLVPRGTAVTPNELLPNFSWHALPDCCQDIVVTSEVFDTNS
ncbi:MAG: tRNA glutamyl-Q(34) synthetase GluQRS [Atopobium sp.]|uniref:tRNA glutamyl-Q(34) synthetase GluQRS n=1 Tax=Atopobium sp. TaxID=1872650 RepID=UPI002A815DEC|nr:tRNA glutamyl-Q(34) synthetase GluQRS [Atopobium sp.]MDY4522687.1 tRNA glutamyl-Q(34) synthetase GluQRS [Atopobium sp.]